MGIPWSRPTDGRPTFTVLQEREVIESTIARDTGINRHAQDLPVSAVHLNNDLAEEPSEAPSPSTPDRKADAKDTEPALEVTPTEAFQRYQKSAAEAAAHPPEENGQAPAAEGATKGRKGDSGSASGDSHRSRKRRARQPELQGSPQTQQGTQKGRKRDSGTAPGDSHRSRKRRAQAASQMQSTEAQGMHAHSEAEGQASGPPSGPPSSAAKRRGQAQSSAATPAAQTPKSSGRKSKGWQYMGADLKCVGVNQDDWVHCPDGRSYPHSMTYKEGDLLVEEYLDKTDDDQLYEVEAIIDERRRGKAREFRGKWKGFEMNPEEFMPYENLEECAALDQWEAKLGIQQPSER